MCSAFVFFHPILNLKTVLILLHDVESQNADNEYLASLLMISILLERLRSTPASPMGMGVSYKYNNHNPLCLGLSIALRVPDDLSITTPANS